MSGNLASTPKNRVFFDPASESAINGLFTFMQQRNLIFDAMVTYLKTTNTSLANPPPAPSQAGSVTEAVLKIVKKRTNSLMRILGLC